MFGWSRARRASRTGEVGSIYSKTYMLMYERDWLQKEKKERREHPIKLADDITQSEFSQNVPIQQRRQYTTTQLSTAVGESIKTNSTSMHQQKFYELSTVILHVVLSFDDRKN